jgi:hypothetical protein
MRSNHGEAMPDDDDVFDALVASPVSFPGPFEHHDVVVNGYAVPFLRATPLDGGTVRVHLDRRFALDLDAQEAERVIPFLAECFAVALGNTCHPCSEVPEPPPIRAAVPVHAFRRLGCCTPTTGA